MVVPGKGFTRWREHAKNLMRRAIAYGAIALACGLAGRAHADDVRPAVLVPASSDKAVVTVHLTSADKPDAMAIEAGALVNAGNPDLKIVPRVTVTAVSGKDKDWDLTIAVDQLIPFGDSTVPLLYRGEQKQTLCFVKAGLVAKPATEGGFSVRDGSQLAIILEDPTAFEYPTVRMRLRFQNAEVCQAAAEKAAASNGKCDDPNRWFSFSVLKYSPATLRVIPA